MAEMEEKEQAKEEEETTEAAEETTFICQSLYKVLSDKPVSHSRLLPSLARAAFKKLSIDPQKDLSFIAAGRGPGSFTGLRAGLAFAKGLSMGAGIPAIGINSLEAMSADPSVPPGISVPVIDARHGEVFASVYMAGAGLPPVALSGILALKPGSFYSEIALILDSARKSRDLPEGPVRILGKDSALLPPPEEGFALCPRPLDPGALAALAARAFKSGAFRENPPLPLYGRSPEIFKTWKPPIREALS
jgi:tRNA threonylcarbamoyladenosine biosynthesis protein TsaB